MHGGVAADLGEVPLGEGRLLTPELRDLDGVTAPSGLAAKGDFAPLFLGDDACFTSFEGET
jgi:hypothetical protein